MKRNELRNHANIRIDLKGIILSERSHAENVIYCIPFI